MRSPKKKNRLRLAFSYLIVQLSSFSTVFFIRNEIDINKSFPAYDGATEKITLRDGNEAHIRFLDGYADVMDCYRFNRKERLEICSLIHEEWRKEGIKGTRSIQSLSAEMLAHKIAYSLGISKADAKDAGLTYQDDERWYVRVATDGLEVLGL